MRHDLTRAHAYAVALMRQLSHDPATRERVTTIIRRSHAAHAPAAVLDRLGRDLSSRCVLEMARWIERGGGYCVALDDRGGTIPVVIADDARDFAETTPDYEMFGTRCADLAARAFERRPNTPRARGLLRSRPRARRRPRSASSRSSSRSGDSGEGDPAGDPSGGLA